MNDQLSRAVAILPGIVETLKQANDAAESGAYCQICGWRAWGKDSWDGHHCKCNAPRRQRLLTRDEIEERNDRIYRADLRRERSDREDKIV
jgi:hypothetical protein